MKLFNKKIFIGLIPIIIFTSCTKLNSPVYNQIQNKDFWNTPDQIAAGLAPAYFSLRDLVDNYFASGEASPGYETLILGRGPDWLGADFQNLPLHIFQPNNTVINGLWASEFNGITQCNFELQILASLVNKPSNINGIVSELKILRAYYYLQALNDFGNVPLVTTFNVDPGTITNNNTKQSVFNFIESELKANIPLANPNVDAGSYGRATKWFGFTILAKLYLNAQAYTGAARWADCANACDSILLSGKYALNAGFFDSFKPDNDYNNNPECIFAVPFDYNYIKGMNLLNFNLPFASQKAFGLLSSSYNGLCIDGEYYYNNFDTSSVYTQTGGKVYRAFNDQRTGQYLIDQLFNTPYSYPPDKNILIASNVSADSTYSGGIPAYLTLNFDQMVYPITSPIVQAYGARSLKYFPQAGTSNGASNDFIVYRLADILLMRAEATMRGAPEGATGSSVSLVNQVRTRAYSGDASHNWTTADLTPANLLAERTRELSGEYFRRQDLIRFDVADGTNYFGGARGSTGMAPVKPADATDNHLRLFPIPTQQNRTNPNLVQNPGYPGF